MKKILILISTIVVLLSCTSCLATGKSAGIQQNYDIKALNAQLQVLSEAIKVHDNEIITLNNREKAILDDMNVNLDKMEELYNSKDEKIKMIKTVLSAYEFYSVNLTDDEKIIAKSLAYDKIEEIINNEEN